MMARFRNTLLATTAFMPLGILAAAASPQGSQVVGGAANVQGQGTSTVTVTQSTDKAIINWQTFNIGSGETTQFVQPNSSSVTLNRVTGGLGASTLDGTLTANGRVFLVNPDGILFGAGSKINTGSFLATTNDIRNADFMAGRYQFNIPGRPDASIVNLGTITAQNGGFAALVAPGVRNTGTITAKLGTVGLAAGNNFCLDFYGDRLITLGVNDSIAAKVIDVATGQPLNALVQNDGKLKANGGRVELTAAAARQVVDSVINNTGVIEANSIGSKNGMIVLGAATAATKPAGAPTQTIKLSGTISAAGKRKNTKGGTIVVTGENIQITSAMIDASGQMGGGKVLIGGDVGGGKGNAAVAGNSKAALESFTVATASTVSVDAASTINASAKTSGDGGKVIVWSDQATTFYGTIKAQGGLQSGNGGFVETSSRRLLAFAGARVDTSAAHGRSGLWRLDPDDLTIDSSAAATISGNLSSTDVLVQTTSGAASGPGVINPAGTGDIFINSNISWNSTHTLTFNAYNEIFLDATINGPNGGLSIIAENHFNSFHYTTRADINTSFGEIHQMGSILAWHTLTPTPTPPPTQIPANLFNLAPSNNSYFKNLTQVDTSVANSTPQIVNQGSANWLMGLFANFPGIDKATEYAIATLIGNAVDGAIGKTLLSPAQTQAFWNAFADNLKSENTITKGDVISLIGSQVTKAVGKALELEMHSAGYSEYLIQPTKFVVELALNDGFAALNPENAKLGGPEIAVVYSSIQSTAGQLVSVAQAGIGLWSDIQSLKANFVTLNASVAQLYSLAKQQQSLGNLAESNRLLKLASSTQTTINNLRKEYTVDGVSILESSGWNLLSIFAN